MQSLKMLPESGVRYLCVVPSSSGVVSVGLLHHVPTKLRLRKKVLNAISKITSVSAHVSSLTEYGNQNSKHNNNQGLKWQGVAGSSGRNAIGIEGSEMGRAYRKLIWRILVVIDPV